MWLNLYTLLLIGVTLAVILSRRTIYSILFLILLFALVAVFVYSLGVDFIGLIFVIVYVGAIATLFLFIVMMLGGEDWEPRSALDLETNNLLNSSGFVGGRISTFCYKSVWYLKHVVFDLFLMFGFSLSVISLFSNSMTGHFSSWLDLTQTTYNASMFESSFSYGLLFYDYWYLPFLIAGVVLLIAMLGSIVLTTRLFLPTGKESKISQSKNEAPISDEERKRILTETPPMFAKIVEKQKLDLETPFTWWFPQLLWSGICAFVGLALKDIFIVSAATRVIYVATISIIYLGVSYKLLDYLATKRASKKSRK
jgi:NADH:ubiquinone oxidoreductase subunit 6 (subunit J)